MFDTMCAKVIKVVRFPLTLCRFFEVIDNFGKNFFRLGQDAAEQFQACGYGSAAAILDVSNFIRIFAD